MVCGKTQFSKMVILSAPTACPCESLLPGVEPDGAGVGREVEPGDLAGGLAVRAQGQGGLQEGNPRLAATFIRTLFKRVIRLKS